MANILIFGAGAVGQYIGALLTRAGRNNITLIGRVEHYDAIRNSGLTIQKHDGNDYLSKLNFFTLLRHVPPRTSFDWIFMTVKGYDLKKSIMEIKEIIKRSPDVRFLLFQRGVDFHEPLKKLIPPERVFFSALTTNVAILTPGTVTVTNRNGALCLAPMEQTKGLSDLPTVFAGTKIKIKGFTQWEDMKWSALLYEMLNDAICALGDYTPQKMTEFKALLDLDMKAFKEGLKVAKKHRIKIMNLPAYNLTKISIFNLLPGFIRRFLLKKEFTKESKTRVPTIKNDMEKGKKLSEIKFINGAITRWGKEERVDTPVNDFLCTELLKVINSKIEWGLYRKKPQEIMAKFNQYMESYHSREGSNRVEDYG